ncbi:MULTISPECIES: hypothetical protein [unclassified Paenibacillus]|uniref:hypothetical protein n=1 Tax=unclassified Paenibacillus TaxID=185978 RepID=UPI002F422E77
MLRLKSAVCLLIFAMLALLLTWVNHTQYEQVRASEGNPFMFSSNQNPASLHLPREYIKFVPVMAE